MNSIINSLGKLIGKGRVLKLIFNTWPMYRSTGGRVLVCSEDYRYVKIKLPLT
jgi:hypothetical protein